MILGIAGNGVIVEEVLSFIDEIGFDEVRICGRKQSEDKLNTLAKKYNLGTVYTDFDEMLKSDIDVVYVGVLNDLHVEYSRRALEEKKHVICEKPITIKTSELDELDALAKKNGVMLFEAMSVYHMPAYKQLQKDVKLVGDLKLCMFNYSQRSRKYTAFHNGESTPAVFDPAHNGGALRDLNVYNISAMVGLFGEPKGVTYSANMERGVDTSGVLIADYGNFKCICVGSKETVAPGPTTIQGTDATICVYPHVNGMQEYDVIFNDDTTETKEVDYSDGNHRLYFEFVDFKRIIEENDQTACDAIMACSKAVARIIDEATS
ncbi:Gfo/Idh/MocA family protein [Pseudobutyrivibrio xylanivorans]|uniref:Gfo/Idh/MocA family oxidoreductase n=1 Tax=Pseudobutyrivibrio xylanivorans TaxID=185007 RepID=A0A5P6VUP5_PSEXY|nr:Gfo/Idh/MocA family oxidoreductase [Pseudobutyrivibrio xylanivorans]QFJ56042.1 Gfo/Idh/MocA family oxidoreductase [Pseudobutyrivibrio xylanivorans]